MNWRSKTLRESAKHEACVSCGADDGTIVWAHSNEQRHGKGMGIKAHDIFGCFICHRCHSAYDQGKSLYQPYVDGLVLENKQWFREMWERSMIIACEKNYL